jgi:peptide/nickel transport system ATP-binding protein
MEQIVKLQEQFRMSVVLVTHDLGVVAESCQRAIVMYCGSIIENAPIDALFARPRHPYTRGLLDSIPRLRDARLDELPIIPGTVPDLLALPEGCRFAERCDRAEERCARERPALETLSNRGERVACFNPVQAP